MAYNPLDYLTDGLGASIDLSLPVTRLYAEIELNAGGPDGGEGIGTDSLRSEVVRTKVPKVLYGHKDIDVRVAYDPAYLEAIETTAIQVNQVATVTFPDGQGYTVNGWVASFITDGQTEGNRPTAMMKFIISNVNPETGNEEGPDYFAAP